MKTTPPPTKKDYELAELAKVRLDQMGTSPTGEELSAINRILVEQARVRLIEQASSEEAR